MYNLTKKEKLNFVLEKIQELGLSAYEISNNTNFTEAGVARIIKGISKNPHENSLNELILFLENKVLGSELNKIEEPSTTYEKTVFDINKYISCIEKESKLIKEIHRLQGILRKNNIKFSDFFETETE